MATINVRIEDHVRESLNELAAAQGVSLSEYIRDLLREAAVPITDRDEARSGDEPAPETLQFIDRKVLSLLHRILGRVLPEDAEGSDGNRDYQLARARVLEKGFTGEYWMEAVGFSTELSPRDSGRVHDILQMFQVLGDNLARTSDTEDAVGADEHDTLTFQGFDHNHSLEGHMASYVRHLVDDGRWEGFQPLLTKNGGNSHMPMLDIYSRMVAEYRRIMDSKERRYSRADYHLSTDELKAIAAAAVHPSHR